MTLHTIETLAAFYTEAATGKDIWYMSGQVPALSDFGPRIDTHISSYELREPAKKVIDWQKVIDNQLLCEIGKNKHLNFISLYQPKAQYPFLIDGVITHSAVRISSRPVFWQGGDCPLPEGLEVKLFFRKGLAEKHDGIAYVNKAGRWLHDLPGFTTDYEIIAYQVLGLADGWSWS